MSDTIDPNSNTAKKEALRKAALDYHEYPTPGKISVNSTKSVVNQRDLALAYSPGVAFACEEIAADPTTAFRYTARGNLVGVVTNGTAVLGLGAIGPLAAKPVMEGKAVLFKKFAGIDVFDIEIAETDPDKLVEIIAALEPTFGGINLEDIKAPDCFVVERKLRERMKIPVFHDDQHGTAIVVGAGVINALKITGKAIDQVKVVTSGAGAAALACVDLLVELGVPERNIWLTDLAGVVYQGRVELMDPDKARFAQPTSHRKLAEVIDGADIFLGLSAAGVVKPEMVARMAANPIIFALANPNPEIMPEEVKAVRDDAIMATGRTDYPNQVNNVLCFPFIFRGALDSGATTVTREMEIAAVHAVAKLAQQEASDIVAQAYGIENLSFGREYLIPKPFDPRLISTIAPAVALAAQKSGVAARPISDYDAYVAQLNQFVYHSGSLMRPLFAAAKEVPMANKRIVFAEAEEEKVLRAIQVVIDEKLAWPILIGRPNVILQRIERFGLRMKPEADFDLVNPDFDDRYREYWQTYHQMTDRRGVTEHYAKLEMRRRHTLIGSMLVHKGVADGMLCGTFGHFSLHTTYIEQVLGFKPGATVYGAMNILQLPNRMLFLVDTHVNLDPTAEQLAELTVAAADEMKRLGIIAKAALISHSNFGTHNDASAVKMRRVLELVRRRAPWLEIDGEMHGDCAIDEAIRRTVMPNSTLKGDANLLILPDLSAANITYNLLKTAAGNNVAIGPVLLNASAAVHVLTPAATVRRIVNMTALTVVDANKRPEV